MKTLLTLFSSLLVFGLCSLPAAAQTEPGPTFDISPFEPPGDASVVEPIPIPPDDYEVFWGHISWPGHEGQCVHIYSLSWRSWADPKTGATSEVVETYAEPCQWVQVCQWWRFLKVHTTGQVCTYVYFQGDIVLDDGQDNFIGGTPGDPLWSNIVCKHIVPEPGGLAALGMGAVGLLGAYRRRRR